MRRLDERWRGSRVGESDKYLRKKEEDRKRSWMEQERERVRKRWIGSIQ